MDASMVTCSLQGPDHSTHLQGSQCLVGDLIGFGQFTHDLLQLMGNDYPRSPIMLYALRMPQLSIEHPLQRHLASLITDKLRYVLGASILHGQRELSKGTG